MSKYEFWGFSDKEDVASSFDADLSGVNIIFALYSSPSYEGYAWVLFEKDGEFFEVTGSHCSCYGLEGQWEPDPVTKEDIAFRLKNGGHLTYGDSADTLAEVLAWAQS